MKRFATLLALVGLVPFALFWSEFFILRAAVEAALETP